MSGAPNRGGKATTSSAPPLYAARTRVFSTNLLLSCLLALMVELGGARLYAQSPGMDYDLVVLVIAGAGEGERVALSYARAIESATLRESIEKLGDTAGCPISDIAVREVPVREGVRELASDADFLAPGLVHPRGGSLPVGPIIRSLANWSRMRLVFLVGSEFQFSGPGDAEADGFAVRLLERVAPYEYDVERRKGTPAPGGATAPPGRPRHPLADPFAWAVGGLCGAVGLLVGWFVPGRRAEPTSA